LKKTIGDVNIFYSFCILEFACYFQKLFINRFNSKFFHKYQLKQYDLNLVCKSVLLKNFKYNLIKVQDFSLMCYFTTFLLRTVYVIFLRRLTYNYYIRSHVFFYEFQHLKKFFIAINNPFSKNNYKTYYKRYQRMFILGFLNVKGIVFHK